VEFPTGVKEALAMCEMEHLIALAQDRDMGAFLEWVDTLLVLIERHERLDPQASEQVERGDGSREGLQP
jgi:hypothetical protein